MNRATESKTQPIKDTDELVKQSLGRQSMPVADPRIEVGPLIKKLEVIRKDLRVFEANIRAGAITNQKKQEFSKLYLEYKEVINELLIIKGKMEKTGLVFPSESFNKIKGEVLTKIRRIEDKLDGSFEE